MIVSASAADRHLWWTDPAEDPDGKRRLVEAGDPAARFLAYAPGMAINVADLELVPENPRKAAARPADKARQAPQNK